MLWEEWLTSTHGKNGGKVRKNSLKKSFWVNPWIVHLPQQVRFTFLENGWYILEHTVSVVARVGQAREEGHQVLNGNIAGRGAGMLIIKKKEALYVCSDHESGGYAD